MHECQHINGYELELVDKRQIHGFHQEEELVLLHYNCMLYSNDKL